MKRLSGIIAIVLSTTLHGGCAVATESAQYNVIEKSGEFEIRDYGPQVVAETVVAGSLEEAGNQAFRPLFNYISGANRSRDKIAMTAPVSQQPQSEKIPMTAPVTQQRQSEKIPMTAPVTQQRQSEKIPMTTPVGQQSADDGWAVSFLMPASYTLETLPEPEDPRVRLRQVPARRMAAVRYSGTWSESRYHRHRESLEAWLVEQGWQATGDPVWARYNAPFTPWFLRRNEILVEVEPAPSPDLRE